jgi:hypothetical protein
MLLVVGVGPGHRHPHRVDSVLLVSRVHPRQSSCFTPGNSKRSPLWPPWRDEVPLDRGFHPLRLLSKEPPMSVSE